MDPKSAHKVFRSITEKNSPLFDWPAKIILIYIIPLMLLISSLYLVSNQISLMSNQLKQSKQSSKTSEYLGQKPIKTPIQTTDISTWKTYTNKSLGFSIRYPEKIQEHYFHGINSGSNIEITLPNVEHPYLSGQDNNIIIMWYSGSELTPQKIIDILIQQQKTRTPNSVFEKSFYTVDGKKGEMVLEKRSSNEELLHLDIQTNKNILDFSVMYKTKNKEQALKLFDQILSTFKFTD